MNHRRFTLSHHHDALYLNVTGEPIHFRLTNDECLQLASDLNTALLNFNRQQSANPLLVIAQWPAASEKSITEHLTLKTALATAKLALQCRAFKVTITAGVERP